MSTKNEENAQNNIKSRTGSELREGEKESAKCFTCYQVNDKYVVSLGRKT